MNIVDLELYRWQLHRFKSHTVVKLKTRTFSHQGWWENFAFVSMLPRQSGKTEMIIRMAKILNEQGEDFIIVVPNEQFKKNILGRSHIDNSLIEVIPTASAALNFYFKNINDHSKVNLLVDEYQLLHKDALKGLFRYNWSSVSVVGGLKI